MTPSTEDRLAEEGIRVEKTATPAQVALQCKVVASLARSIASVHDDYQKMMESGDPGGLARIAGERTAEFMERLGDMLNSMDAVSDEDEWMTPIFEVAHDLFPVERLVAYDPDQEQRVRALVDAARAVLSAWGSPTGNLMLGATKRAIPGLRAAVALFDAESK
jgi:hypothetical protein